MLTSASGVESHCGFANSVSVLCYMPYLEFHCFHIFCEKITDALADFSDENILG